MVIIDSKAKKHEPFANNFILFLFDSCNYPFVVLRHFLLKSNETFIFHYLSLDDWLFSSLSRPIKGFHVST